MKGIFRSDSINSLLGVLLVLKCCLNRKQTVTNTELNRKIEKSNTLWSHKRQKGEKALLLGYRHARYRQKPNTHDTDFVREMWVLSILETTQIKLWYSQVQKLSNTISGFSLCAITERYFWFFETESHTAQVGFEHTTKPRMGLNFSLSCLQVWGSQARQPHSQTWL